MIEEHEDLKEAFTSAAGTYAEFSHRVDQQKILIKNIQIRFDDDFASCGENSAEFKRAAVELAVEKDSMKTYRKSMREAKKHMDAAWMNYKAARLGGN